MEFCFLYHCMKPKSTIDEYTCNPDRAQGLSDSGYKVTCVMVGRNNIIKID